MIKFLKLSLILLLFSITIANSQDYIESDANTRNKYQQTIGNFEGFCLTVNYAYINSKDIELYFIFEKPPSSYFETFDSLNNVIILEFYDIKVGKSDIDTVKEYPIIKSEYFDAKIDLNKNVEGFQPDIRSVLKVKLFLKYKFSYTVLMDNSIITLYLHWDQKIENKLLNRGAHKFNTLVIILFLLSIIPVLVYKNSIFN